MHSLAHVTPACRLAGRQAVTSAAAVAVTIRAATWPGTWRSGPAGQPGRRRCDGAVPITDTRPASSGPRNTSSTGCADEPAADVAGAEITARLRAYPVCDRAVIMRA